MGREGEWSAPQGPPGAQSTGYAGPASYPGTQYPQGSGLTPPGATQPPQSWGPPLRGAAPSQVAGGLPPPWAAQGQPPQWAGPPSGAGGPLFMPSGPPNAGPPGSGPMGVRPYGPPPSMVAGQMYGAGPPPPSGSFRPPQQQPGPPGVPQTGPTTNAARGPSNPPPGSLGTPSGPTLAGYPPNSGPGGASRPIFSQPLFSSPVPQPPRPQGPPSISSSSLYTPGPPQANGPYSQGQPQAPPSSSPYASGQPQGQIPQLSAQAPRPAMGPPSNQFLNQNANQGPSQYMQAPSQVAPISQQLQGMSLGQQMQGSFNDPSAPPSFSASTLTGSGPPSMGPPTWQTPQRRVYPDAYGGAPPTSSMPASSGAPTQQMPPGPPHFPGNIPPGVPGMSQPGSPAGAQPGSATSRIDPNQIPRPQPTITSVTFETRVNGQANLPPSATTSFIVRDTGNCSPHMMRCSLNQIPCSADLLSTSGMPLVVMVQPLALPHPAEEPIQIVDFGEVGPVRCSAAHCKAYINPFMKFIDQGRRFTCNLCGHNNETPRDYQCNLGPDGKRRDADLRPELSKGTVEFVAPKEYMVRPPMPAVFFFLIDVSLTAIQTGAVVAACSAINRALADLPEGPNTRVGIATFDSTIHFYNLNKTLQTPSMLVVPDIQDVYTPLQNDLIVPLSEGREHLEQLLESIPSMFQNNRVTESAFGAAIKGGYLAMKSTGGKLFVFQTVLPSVGIGALTAREGESKVGEKEAQKLMQPSDKTLKTMAIEFAEFQVCVDLFLMSQNYVDIASIGVVPRTTGGQIYYYHPFHASVDSAKLYNDLRWNVTRPQALEAVMRVRCSQGLQVQEYFGNFCKRNPTDVDLPAIDCDKTIMVTFKHDDKFQDGSECCFQSALLYTTTNGQRRIRVNTLSLSCTTILSNLFRGADLDAQFTYFLKQAAQDVPTTPLVQVRDHMTGQCVTILYTYRKFCATASSSGQLILPEALKLLPLYTLALTKSVGLRSDMRIDERSYWLTRVASLPTSLAIPLVYPQMFAVHNLPSREALRGAILPPVVPLSSENLEHDGIFLMETGEDAFLYAGKQASPEILHKLFGVHSVDEVVPGQFLLQEYDNDLSRRLNEVVNEIRRQRCSYLRLHLLKRGDPRELLFFSFLVEDKTSLGFSYVEFLVHVHRQIQNRMS